MSGRRSCSGRPVTKATVSACRVGTRFHWATAWGVTPHAAAIVVVRVYRLPIDALEMPASRARVIPAQTEGNIAVRQLGRGAAEEHETLFGQTLDVERAPEAEIVVGVIHPRDGRVDGLVSLQEGHKRLEQCGILLRRGDGTSGS